MAEPSGKTQIRLPPALHAHLVRSAEKQGISLNALMVALLAGGSHFKLPK